MSRHIRTFIVFAAILVFAGVAFAKIDVKLKDGSRWRGELQDRVVVVYRHAGAELELQGTLQKVEDLYIVVHGEFHGSVEDRTIFRSDIVSLKDFGADEAEASEPTATVKRSKPRGATSRPGTNRHAVPHGDRVLGVFVLPLDGMVGEGFRHEEIEAIGEEADKYGPGQIIVLEINSNGGLVFESEMITEAIWALKERHRVVAWVKKAISAGCATAMVCDEIYFMTEGTAGSVTTIQGLQHVPEEEVQDHIDNFVEVARRAGYSEHIARSMKLKRFMCSYDKDPVTGEITWYGDTSGEFVLSDGEQNLCFNASNALHSGFSRGTADTEEDLAVLLDLPEWNEISDYGRRIAAEWQETVEYAKEDIQRQIARLDYYKTGGGSQEEVIGARIKIMQNLIRYWDRAPNVCYLMGIAPKEDMERQIAQLRKQIADMRRRGR